MSDSVYGDTPSDGYMNEVYQVFYDSLYHRKGRWMVQLRKYLGDSWAIREFAHPQRRLCESIDQLHKQLLYFGYQKMCDCYISNYAFKQKIESTTRKSGKEAPDYQTAVIDNVAYDFDATEQFPLDKTWEQAQQFSRIYDNYEIYFTGGRGFLFRTRVNLAGHEELTTHQKNVIQIAKERGVMTIDEGHVGDIARVYRVPFTPHKKTGRFMVPVVVGMNIDEVISSSQMAKIRLW